MDSKIYNAYLSILNGELLPALGCTEPIAIALAAAKVKEVLGEMPLSISLECSGNVIKNVQGVIVPNSGGLYGIKAAAILGVLGGNANAELEVITNVTKEQQDKTKELLNTDFCTCKLKEDIDNLFISIIAKSEKNTALVTIVNRHNLITKVEKNNKVLFSLDGIGTDKHNKYKKLLTVKQIVEFADNVDLKDIKNTIVKQIDCNELISKEGLNKAYGACIGKTMLKTYPDHISTIARAKAAAGSDARMAGCTKPVVINAGSGNQGLTVSIPVVEYGKHLNVSQEKIYRAVVLSNLMSIHLKRHIGNLSAFCGAVTAAAGVSAAITYLRNGTFNQICDSITNTLGNVGGIICDGAKSSCAAKISSSVDAAILASEMSFNGCVFQCGEGIIQNDIEDTIRAIGHVGKVGMNITDIEILKIMTQEIKV